MLGRLDEPGHVPCERREARQIPLVVMEHWYERLRAAAAQIIEIHLGNQVGKNVRPALDAQDQPLNLREARRAELQSPQLPRRVQQVHVRARRLGLDLACQAETRFKQRPVEALPVIGHEHPPLFHAFGEGQQHGMLFVVITQKKLLDREPAPLPPRQAHEKRAGPRAACEARGFGVKKQPALGISKIARLRWRPQHESQRLGILARLRLRQPSPHAQKFAEPVALDRGANHLRQPVARSGLNLWRWFPAEPGRARAAAR